MAYRTDRPVAPVAQRLDGAVATRLDTVANEYLRLAEGVPLNLSDRTLMLQGVKALRGADVSDKSDTYLAQRYLLARARQDAGGGSDPTVPADGMAPGSVVAAEVKGTAKTERIKINAYLNRARSELSAGSLRSQMPNPGDVETRAYELAQQDPEGLFK